MHARVLPSEGAALVETSCNVASTEACNAIDDNCDGRVDEGCGYSTGTIQITAAWNSRADLDLRVTDPHHETVSSQHRQAASGGRMDHDGRGACRAKPRPVAIENIRWFHGSPPKGRYLIELYYWGECNDGGASLATVTIAAGGKVLGSYNLEVLPGEHRAVAELEVF